MITNRPKVPDGFILLGVPSVIRMFLPVFDVNVSNTTNKQFQLSLVKHIDKIWRNEFIEASDKGGELLLDSFLDPPLCNKTAKS